MLTSRVLVCDGAMGTMLQASGVPIDFAFAELNVSRPELVGAVHSAFIDAGADIIETNTFGATRLRLERYGLAGRVVELNRAGVEVARKAGAASGKKVLVAGSVGPATPSLSPARLGSASLHEAFEEQLSALCEAGVDVVIFETFGSLDELIDAISAAREIDRDLPLVAQLTFLDDGRTLSGESPAEAARYLERLELAAIGVNCTLGPQGLLDVLTELSRHTSMPLAAQPNAGSPAFIDGRFRYTSDPEYFARYAARYVELGATLVGGCCGTTPDHIRALAAIRGPEATSRPSAPRQEPPGVDGDTRRPGGGFDLKSRLEGASRLTFVEVRPTADATVEKTVEEVRQFEQLGCDAVLVSPAPSARAQTAPASLATLLQQRVPSLEPLLGVSVWEKSVAGLQADLLGAHALGIRNIVCRDDEPPVVGDYPGTGGFREVDAIGLLTLLKGLNQGRDRRGSLLARPTDFTIGAELNLAAADVERAASDARRKLDAGAEFFVTPPVFDLGALDRLLDAIDPPAGFPVLMAVMLLRDYRHAEFLHHEVPGMSLPAGVLRRMQSGDEHAGVGIAHELMEAATADPRLRGVVLCSPGTVSDLVPLMSASRTASA
jgi:homocysteine S-methyltransferase